jgi:predicted nucleotidyltransferase component of viral defense system
MTEADLSGLRLHKDAVLFREAVAFTAAQTGFAARLIEKDYFCSLLLDHLTRADSTIVFKGGTCLAKVHTGFYRLSEDLDFVVSVPVQATRSERRRKAAGPKVAMARLGEQPDLRLVSGPTGANRSTQYVAVVGYDSLLGFQTETIKIEVGLREPLLTSAERHPVRTLLLNPISGEPFIPSLVMACISRLEAMAEKLRAALSRRQVAIRDFYDVDYAVRQLGLEIDDSELVGLVHRKLKVPGNDPVDVSSSRFEALELQVTSQLKPVLRKRDFKEFDLQRAFSSVAEVAAALAGE